MNILGINCVFHESSAAVVIDGRVVAAVEEERFNRVKHAKPALVGTADVLPAASISFCLEAAGLSPEDIDLVACSFDPEIRRKDFETDPLSRPGDWGSADGEKTFLRSIERIPEAVRAEFGIDTGERFRWVPHHIAHAASAYYPCGDEQAAVLVVDGIGEAATALLGGGDGTVIHRLHELHYPNSIGFVWEKLSAFLGFSPYDASKVMGLAAYGDADTCAGRLAEIVGPYDTLAVRSDQFAFRLDGFENLESRFGPRRLPGEQLAQRHADLAAALQRWNDRTILSLARRAHDLHPASTLCYAGGVALNCATNWLLKEEGPFSRIYIPCAPHDGGTALGAALWAYYDSGVTELTHPALDTACTGPGYTDEEITAAFAEAGLTARRSPDIALDVARRIAAGQVVGWFQGRMELGPRALGNRSLVADPRDPGIRDTLNRKVKHREDFRPFAPSVLAEHARDWFELGHDSESHRFMLYTCPVRPGRAEDIPAVLHIDGTARVQTVTSADNPRYHRLISCFEELTGVPMVLNTSFNDSEPIVCSPRDALATFAATRIDAVAIGDHIASR
ncbi:carbamoyltransferase family protein [Streptomyces clavuligerus]|uniref:Putative carbamoyl transferase n=1 Tax=Streptomyces clavuligerus TaxID=1901 RepID=D5SM47_STRCL|nr:carbamoyltransferase C-terminal domain-containing protein [Streptomyces clavuligerus]EFG04990.1 putative carbamoyl transferase [Streptomyces clavuligerus]MBY6306587.1 carbamoyltransferase [Streptomyces clavuligerus]QCS10807.1 carbamoyltransferase [Streptomyces clavuligerus]QPJ97157.1 carbamoyltransferase [Streptomyces clavuligerus]WDN57512.1 carbamoyltransferase [Streptomyces clavuligerus]